MQIESGKVSIIIPAYNVEKYIFRAIESSIKQTYKNIEIIIVDDGSTDQTLKVIKKYADIDERVIYIHQTNKGVAIARNEGMKSSTGEFVIFLDSDDWLEPNAVERLVCKKLKYPQFLIASDFNHVCEVKGKLKIKKEEVVNFEKILDKNEALKFIIYTKYHIGSTSHKLFDRRIIMDNSICFPDGITHGEDGLFMYKYLSHCEGVFFFAEQLWNMFDRPGSATSNYNINWLTSIKAVDEMKSYNKYKFMEEPLEAYRVARIMMILSEYVFAKENDIKVYNFLKKEIRGKGDIYCKYYRGGKMKIVWFVYTFFPKKIIRGFITLCRLKNKIKENVIK